MELLVSGADVDAAIAAPEADVVSLQADLARASTVAAAEGDLAVAFAGF